MFSRGASARSRILQPEDSPARALSFTAVGGISTNRRGPVLAVICLVIHAVCPAPPNAAAEMGCMFVGRSFPGPVLPKSCSKRSW